MGLQFDRKRRGEGVWGANLVSNEGKRKTKTPPGWMSLANSQRRRCGSMVQGRLNHATSETVLGKYSDGKGSVPV